MVLGRLSVSRRIVLVLAICIATPTVISIYALANMRATLLAARASEVQHLEETAWTLVANFHHRAMLGLVTESAAQEAAKDAIRHMRYDETNYFFVWDLSGTAIAHGGNPKLEGRRFLTGPDAVKYPGIADMVRELVGMARSGKASFGSYRMPKAGQTIPLDKIAYANVFEPWGWIIGTGAYVADIDAMFWSRAKSDLILASLLTGLAGLLPFALGRDLSRSLQGLTRVVNTLAGGNLAVAIPSTARGDEVGVLARAMNVFKENAVEAARKDAALRQASMRLEAAFSNMSQGICVHDADERLEIFNGRFCTILGLNPADVRPGLSIREVMTLSFAAGNYPGQEIEDVLAQKRACINRRETGATMIELAGGRLTSVIHCPMPDGGWLSTFEDITERRAADERIVHLTRYDSLTGLPNRLMLSERIEQGLVDTGRSGQSALLCLDLDEFKRVNDTLGHAAGDALLVAVAERLQACVREGDTVARLGGDEFAIVQVGILRPEDAKLLAERLIATIQQPFLLDGHPVGIGVSIGLALMPNDGGDQITLLKNADIALDRAKAEERGRFCFFEADMDARLQRRRQLELDLRAGLAANEFELFYQPLVNLVSKQVAGFEALIRWRHPKRGMVSPAEFIPIAEEIGLIVPLGEWVIRQACAEAISWPDGIKVAVNLSPNQFRSRNLVPTVVRSLKETGLPANRLELEVTETLLLQDNDSTLAMLHELRALGTRISMDDFGTGYSSLSYLRRFPFDKIKIDQSFVRDLSRRDDAIHIVRAIRGLCAGLGMTTTAEGVETEEQFDKVFAEGCTEVQGYLFSPPRPADEIPAILERIRLRHATRAALMAAE